MDGAIAEIYDPDAVAPAKDQVGAAVAGIGADRDFAVVQSRDHLLIGNVRDIGAAADHVQPAGPARHRHPPLATDLRFLHRASAAITPAKAGKIARDSHPRAARDHWVLPYLSPLP